jgi:Calcineurin-like phosphoesterase
MTECHHKNSTSSGARLIAALALCLFTSAFGPAVSAQVSFVQITDPHVFDDRWENEKKKSNDPTRIEDNRLDNQGALASCLWNINERIKKGAKYDFGVITGDLGIEFLVANVDKKTADERIRLAAADLASLLILSEVPTWLIVPGNNDVPCEDPAKIGYYHQFVAEVQNALGTKKDKLIDLTPSDSAGDSRSHWFLINGYAFIGFNDTSFKNNDDTKDKTCSQTNRITTNADRQKEYIVQVEKLLERDEAKFAYVIYHIPEIDDPYYVTLKPNDEPLRTRHANRLVIGDSFFESSWYVRKDVRDEWAKVVMNPKVKGLFAGHFHSNKRESYLGFQWLKTKYLPETLAKLHVCPPIALKIQYDQSARARGYREVYVDSKGEPSTRIVWLDEAGWGLANDVEVKESEALRQLALGGVYESTGHLKEAEAAYVKASESNWPPTRDRAITSAERVVGQQNSYSEKYVLVPLRAALGSAATTAGVVIGTFVILALLILFVAPFARDFGQWRGRNKLRIVASAADDGAARAAFEQVIVMIHGRMSTHYSRRHSVLVGRQPLPMRLGSQTGELADLAESIAPGAVGKVIGWLIKKTDSPQYTIAGTVQTPFVRGTVVGSLPLTGGAVFLTLSERGDIVRTWHNTQADELADEEIRLAFKALKHLARRQNP